MAIMRNDEELLEHIISYVDKEEVFLAVTNIIKQINEGIDPSEEEFEKMEIEPIITIVEEIMKRANLDNISGLKKSSGNSLKNRFIDQVAANFAKRRDIKHISGILKSSTSELGAEAIRRTITEYLPLELFNTYKFTRNMQFRFYPVIPRDIPHLQHIIKNRNQSPVSYDKVNEYFEPKEYLSALIDLKLSQDDIDNIVSQSGPRYNEDESDDESNVDSPWSLELDRLWSKKKEQL